MGNRGTIVSKEYIGPYDGLTSHQNIETNYNEIYFYTHWSGSDLPQILASALSRGRSRWDDSSYLNRIIFSEMTKDEKWDELTGFGITSCGQIDSQTNLIVDHKTQTVEYKNKKYPFEDFIQRFK